MVVEAVVRCLRGLFTAVCALGFMSLVSIVTKGADLRWSDLDAFQGVVSREVFVDRMDQLYAPKADWRQWIEISDDCAWIRTERNDAFRYYRLAFATSEEDTENTAEKTVSEKKRKPLAEWKIALDAGHLGGEWGPMEARSFAIGDQPVVQEGDLVLAAALRLKALLEEAGAEVSLVRASSEPVTRARPDDFVEQAFRDLAHGVDGLPTPETVRKRAEALFYRRSEIQARADRVNDEIKPDLVLALHIDATAWPDGETRQLVTQNTGHVLVNGSYLSGELADDENRLALLWRLLRGYEETELTLADSIARAMATATGLQPMIYTGDNATQVGDSPYVYARNLMANRLYRAPVIYLEPWTLNSEEVYPWAALGDYDGEQEVNGKWTRSLPVVYADFVFAGLKDALGDG